MLISLEDYTSITETHYLLFSRNNAEHLERSLRSAREGSLLSKELLSKELLEE